MRDCSVVKSCPTLCDPMDCNLPGSSVHGVFQAILEGCSFLFQSIFPSQELNPHLLCLLLWLADSLPLSYLRNPTYIYIYVYIYI